MNRRTKIVCTLGPAVDSRDQIKWLIEAGMNVARLNCSHGDWDKKRQWIEWIKELSPQIGPVGILADLQGPKFRIGEVLGGQLQVSLGQNLKLGPGPSCQLPVEDKAILSKIEPGDRVLLGDGDIELDIQAAEGEDFVGAAVCEGVVKSRQGITVAGKSFDVPALTKKDVEDARLACEAGVDFLALSYVHKAGDLSELRELMGDEYRHIKLCAKIESREAFRAIDEIMAASDLIMVARGDLGLQMEIEEVPLAQKRIIAKCNQRGKPVITATQMLESMCESPRPTRAEAADVANAILDGTDAVMLSGETAAGAYPIESVRMMARIAARAETQLDHMARLAERPGHLADPSGSTEAVAHAAVDLATHLKAHAILTTTTSGHTPRMVSKFRPKAPILCVAWNDMAWRQMSVVWGVEAARQAIPVDPVKFAGDEISAFLDLGRLKVGDTVVVTAGVPPGTPGSTNLIYVDTVT